MALMVWLPLNGDLRNQGLSDVTVTNNGATVDNNGKLGKCYYFDGVDDRITVDGLSLPNTWSYCCWIYSAASSRGWEGVIMLNTTGGDADLQLGFYTYPAGNRIQNTANGQYNSEIAWTYGVWHHFCGTFDGSSLKTYIDGNLVNTKAITASILSRANLTIGARCNNANNTSASYFFQGKLNDVRIYSYALSPQQVKRLSQGLVLHYRLSGVGGENLLTGTNNGAANWQWTMQVGDFTKAEETTLSGVKGCKFTRGSTAQSGWSVIYYSVVDESIFEASTNYTLSVDIYPSVATSFIVSVRQANGTNDFITNSNTQSVVPNKWNRIVLNLTTVSTLPSSTEEVIYFQNMNSDTGVSYIFRNLKLEKGDKATPWCPNPSDPEYSLMGFDDDVEYDCSGFGNNGTRVGELNWSSNTPRYNTSLDITSDSCARYIWTPYFSNLTDKITLACWVYQTTTSATSGGNTTNNLFIAGQDRDYKIFGFGLRSMNGIAYVYAGTTNNPEVALSSRINIVNGWHHLVATYDGVVVKIYVDGVLKNSANATGDLDWTQVSNAFVIGKMSYWYTLTEAYFPFRGYISDVRLYATALSTEDVLSLYQLGGSLDSSGTFHTYEYVEA